ncbi:hypothetical protein ACFYT7_22585 [Streptomyces sp. NPDC004041]
MKLLGEERVNRTTGAEHEIAREIEERLCYVCADPDQEDVTEARFALSDGH